MQLTKLLLELARFRIYGKRSVEVKSITQDSRKAKNGSLFVAVKGANFDGHEFVSEAIKMGSRVIVGERKKSDLKITKGVTYVQVENSRHVLSLLASSFYGFPSSKLKVIGVTGTDGKTTTVNLIYNLLKASGEKVGVVSTIGAKIGRREIDTGFHVTNPDVVTLHGLLADMVDKKCKYAVIEVTSHGLDQERVGRIEFDSAVLTNITHEHLDYHGSFEKYRDAKMKLFKMAKSFVVLNKDDESFNFISSATPPTTRRITYSIKDKNVTLYARNIREVNFITDFEVVRGGSTFAVRSKLLGEYNVLNILAAVAVALEYKVDIKKIKSTLYSFEAPKGRMQKIENEKGIDIFIDFAHTPNSLQNVLSYLRGRLNKKGFGRLIAIFGCAGERDIEKRALMGKIAAKIADISVFTAEDPRSEKVEKIINQIAKGAKMEGGEEIKLKKINKLSKKSLRLYKNSNHIFLRIPERGEAISYVLQKLIKRGDIVVICGKGHERTMAYGSVEYEWSDHEAVDLALKGRVKTIKRL